MPDPGRYALVVGAAYAVTLLALGVLVALSWWQGRRVRRALTLAEERLARAVEQEEDAG